MIRFVGSDKSYYAQEVADSLKLPFECNSNITYWTTDLVEQESLKSPCEILVIDIGYLTESAEEIAAVIKKISFSITSKIIIAAEGFSTDSTLMLEIIQLHLPLLFITSQNPTTIKEKYEYAFVNKENEIIPNNQENTLESYSSPSRHIESSQINNFITIAVAGCMNRIGTTTQSIQIAKYFIANNKSACVVEMNQSGYFKLMSEYYAAQYINHEIGQIRIENVDLFYHPENISQILSIGYDYIIYDFGAFHKNFPKTQFIEKQYKFIVAGTKPNELVQTLPVLQSFSHDDVNYIFSFTPEVDQKDVLELMKDKQKNTFFAEYIPDAFTLLSQSLATFQSIFHNSPPLTPVEKKKNKFRFFK